MNKPAPLDHGGGLDAAIAEYGGTRTDWMDLSTGVNPVPYPVSRIEHDTWAQLPDKIANDRLLTAARRFWKVPDGAAIVAAPGTSALICRMPDLTWNNDVHIPGPTYNEHAAAFRLAGRLNEDEPESKDRVFVHPNNPDGQLWDQALIWGDHRELTVVDESFCDTIPEASHIDLTDQPGIVVLKSFGKFWGLAGLRLGFAIATPHTLARPGFGADDPVDLEKLLGPWAVSGPALAIGAQALEDDGWAQKTRQRLTQDAARLDTLITAKGAALAGGTSLFRLYHTDNAKDWQHQLASHKIWSRIFPYSKNWLRLGLPHHDRWAQLVAAL